MLSSSLSKSLLLVFFLISCSSQHPYFFQCSWGSSSYNVGDITWRVQNPDFPVFLEQRWGIDICSARVEIYLTLKSEPSTAYWTLNLGSRSGQIHLMIFVSWCWVPVVTDRWHLVFGGRGSKVVINAAERCELDTDWAAQPLFFHAYFWVSFSWFLNNSKTNPQFFQKKYVFWLNQQHFPLFITRFLV